MQKAARHLIPSGGAGEQPQKGQREDEKTEDRQPEQVERKPDGGAPEGVEHERQGGELRGHGTAERQPEKFKETFCRRSQGRQVAVQDLER